MFSKLFLFFGFTFLCLLSLASNDKLQERILKYNKLDKTKVAIDSNKIFYDLKLQAISQKQKSTIEIIKYRNFNPPSSLMFWMISLFVFSFVRFKSGGTNGSIFNRFFGFKSINYSHQNSLKNFLISVSFISLLSYFIFQLNTIGVDKESLAMAYFTIVALISILMLYKFVFYKLVLFIFDISRKVKDVRHIVFDSMYIFVFISLPTLFITALTNQSFQKPMFIGILTILILLIIFMYIKIVMLNFHLLTRNVFNLIIYFYVVEIIPILLFLKYLKL